MSRQHRPDSLKAKRLKELRAEMDGMDYKAMKLIRVKFAAELEAEFPGLNAWYEAHIAEIHRLEGRGD